MDSKPDYRFDAEASEADASELSTAGSLVERKQFSEAIQALTNWLDQRGIKDGSTAPAGVDNHLISMVYNSRGHAKYLQVDFDGAHEDYNQSLKYDVNNPYAYYNRGTIAYRMGNFQTAESDMKKACELDPQSAEFQLALSRCIQQINLESKS